MSALSQHITPILYGRPFFDKPIWSYWMIQGGFALLGPTHFAARLPSIVAALATLGLVAYAAWTVWGQRTSLLATAVLATSYIFFYYATMAMSDMWLTLFCTAAMIFLFAGSESPNRRLRDWCIASAFCGLAVLTKGPVGVVLPVAACAVYLALRRGLRQIGLREALAGVFVFTRPSRRFLVCPVAVEAARDGRAASIFLRRKRPALHGRCLYASHTALVVYPAQFCGRFSALDDFPAGGAGAVSAQLANRLELSRKPRAAFLVVLHRHGGVFFWVARSADGLLRFAGDGGDAPC